MVVRTLVVCVVLMLCVLNSARAAEEEYPPVPPPEDTSSYGKHFQRSMTLMATSTPERRNTVRILYYGQSIMGQQWSEEVDAYLREKYPHCDFVTKNLALGGFSSQRLVRTMDYDVFPFYPDLLVFHVFGSHIDYETIIRQVRRRTAAEIIMQSDHANKWPEPKAESIEGQESWSAKMNYWHLPGFARKYGCAWQPQRREWVDYLKAHDLEPEALLKDGVHLNEHGRWLMAELLKRFMVYLPEEPDDEWRDLTTTYVVGRDVQWQDGRLRLEFEGNRVVALAAPGPQGEARVLIDGKAPSEFPECYAFTRPSGTAGVGWPAIKRISHQTPLVVEQWTATFHDFNEDQTEFTFTVEGSVTGPDGEGRAGEKFVSDSGRVVIEPQDWVFEYCKKVSGESTPDGWQVRWRVEPLFVDTYAPAEVTDPAAENATVLASGLTNGPHTLELVSETGHAPAIQAIRAYKPPLE
ncbi:MAG: SGNH/GDSL hydrolase family protein [Candidatus Brocadiia bacterium]